MWQLSLSLFVVTEVVFTGTLFFSEFTCQSHFQLCIYLYVMFSFLNRLFEILMNDVAWFQFSSFSLSCEFP